MEWLSGWQWCAIELSDNNDAFPREVCLVFWMNRACYMLCLHWRYDLKSCDISEETFLSVELVIFFVWSQQHSLITSWSSLNFDKLLCCFWVMWVRGQELSEGQKPARPKQEHRTETEDRTMLVFYYWLVRFNATLDPRVDQKLPKWLLTNYYMSIPINPK